MLDHISRMKADVEKMDETILEKMSAQSHFAVYREMDLKDKERFRLHSKAAVSIFQIR